MAKPGPRPLPTALKILRGNPGKRRLNPDEPHPDPVASSLDPPATLDDLAAKEWRLRAPMLRRAGLLTEADVDLLTLFCQTFSKLQQAERQVAAQGMIIMTPRGPKISPWAALAVRLQRDCLRLLVEFGCSPSSRSRVTTAKATSMLVDNRKPIPDKYLSRPVTR